MPYRFQTILFSSILLSSAISSAQWKDVELAFNSGDYQKAIQAIGVSIGTYPENAGNYIVRGMCYARLNDLVQAVKDYDHAIELNSNVLFSQMYKDTYKDIAEEKKRLQDYENDLRWRPMSLAFRLRGDVFFQLEDYVNAILDYDSAIQSYAQNVEAYVNRGNANMMLKDKQHAFRDWIKAANLGHQGSQDILRENGIRW